MGLLRLTFNPLYTFLLVAVLCCAATLPATSAHAVDPFDSKQSDDPYEDRDYYRERRRDSGLMGKIQIDLQRPDAVVQGGVTEKGLYVVAFIFTILGIILFLIFSGRREMIRYTPDLFVKKKLFEKANQKNDGKPKRPRKTTIVNYYEILGLNSTASDEEIKARYKHLAKSFHSDKLANRDLPDEVLELTDEQFKKIQTAYAAIRVRRGFQ